MLQHITATMGATLIFITFLIVIIMFIAHHLYSRKLTSPNRHTKPHNDLTQYYKTHKNNASCHPPHEPKD